MSVAAGGSECGGRPRPWRGGGWRRCDGWPLVWCRWRGASRAAARSAGCCVLCPKVLSAARKSPPPSAAQPVSRRPCKAHCAKGGSPSKKVKTVYTLAELGGERGGATERREELVEGGGRIRLLENACVSCACVCMFCSYVCIASGTGSPRRRAAACRFKAAPVWGGGRGRRSVGWMHTFVCAPLL